MCVTDQALTLPSHQYIADQWLAVLRRRYPQCDAAAVAVQLQRATRDFYRFLSGSPATWDLNQLMPLLAQPSLKDLLQVFSALRAAARAAARENGGQAALSLGEHLDNWVAQVVANYDAARAQQTQQRWQEMVQRVSRLNTLSYCVTELNMSLDLASAVKAVVELARLLTDADMCILYQRDADTLRQWAYAGGCAAPAAAVSLEGLQLPEQVVIDRQHEDAPLAAVRRSLGVPAAQALHCLSLRTASVVTGKLACVYFTERAFSPQELRLHEIFAGHAAQALYNAQLYERLSALTAANERRQIACEMHDTLLQTLIALNINLRVMHNYAQQGQWGEVLPLIETVRGLGKAAMQEGRDTLNDLRECDGGARAHNLIDALLPELSAFADRAGFEPDFVWQQDVRAPAAVTHHLCRLVGEALTNVHRHASASRVQVTVAPAGAGLLVEVRDNGVGFQPARVDQRRSFGLLGMHERARLIDAQITIDTAPARGTTVTISCPLPPANGRV